LIMYHTTTLLQWARLLCTCCLMALWAPLSYAATPAKSAPAGSPTIVDVGIYLNNIPSMNLKEKKFQADFHVWFRWKGDDVNPLDNFEIVNGHMDVKEGPVKKKIGDVNYGSYRVVATLYRNFELSRYPLDDHPLKIQIEDTASSSAHLKFRADTANTGLSPKIDIPGWTIGKFEGYTSVTRYATNFGDISNTTSQSLYPRYTLAVELKRGGWGNFIKLFSMLFLATGLAFCSFRIRADYIDARIALAASGVFLAVLTQNTLATNLPESDSFGMADQLYFLTMGFIGVVFMMCIYTFKIILAGDEARANKLSRLAGLILPPAYIAAVAAFVAMA
jgi:hypothetical protein